MATLTEEQKRFIVQRLACFRTPQEVANEVEQEWGIKMDRGHVRAYNPLQRTCTKKWQALFDRTREEFLAGQAKIGIAHAVFRLQELDRMYRRVIANKRPNDPLALQVLEQAAKESGGAYTSTRKLEGTLTVESISAEFQKLGEAIAKNVTDPEVLAAIEREWAAELSGDRSGSSS